MHRPPNTGGGAPATEHSWRCTSHRTKLYRSEEELLMDEWPDLLNQIYTLQSNCIFLTEFVWQPFSQSCNNDPFLVRRTQSCFPFGQINTTICLSIYQIIVSAPFPAQIIYSSLLNYQRETFILLTRSKTNSLPNLRLNTEGLLQPTFHNMAKVWVEGTQDTDLHVALVDTMLHWLIRSATEFS